MVLRARPAQEEAGKCAAGGWGAGNAGEVQIQQQGPVKGLGPCEVALSRPSTPVGSAAGREGVSLEEASPHPAGSHTQDPLQDFVGGPPRVQGAPLPLGNHETDLVPFKGFF